MNLRWFVLGMVGVAAASLAVGLGLDQFWNAAGIVLMMGALWGVGVWRGIGWPANLGLFFFASVAAYGALKRIPMLWLLPGITAALLAWDLGHFRQYLNHAREIRHESALKRGHYLRLGLSIGLGLALSRLALRVETALTPFWAILLGLLGIFSLSRVIRFMRRESE